MEDRQAWVAACAVAETIGMAASAAAARGAGALPATWPLTAGLGLVVAGGLVEGAALGTTQSAVLARRLPALRRGRYLLVTLLVAGLGWAAASAPSALSADDAPTSAGPPLVLVLLGAAGLGLAMGPVLGGAQALTMRRSARHPRRWVLANTLAWPPAMVVIFLGATSADADWTVAAVTALGAVTGAAAGTVLGLVTAPFLPEAV